MRLRTKIAGGIVLALAVAALAGAGVWYFFIRSTPPPAVSIESAVQSAGVDAPSAKLDPSSLVGTWHVVPDSSFVGYRVNENLAGFGANTAVGRTSSLQGTLQYDGKSITQVQVTADLTTLKSDRSQRDGTLRTQGLQTGRFPQATFVLTSPIALDQQVAEGTTVQKTVEGDLTLHGVTKHISMDVQGQMKGGQVIIVGSTQITFADYGISPPKAGPVLSIDDHGVMELQLVFARA